MASSQSLACCDQGEEGSSPALVWLAHLLKSRSGLVIGSDKLYLLETRLQPLLHRERLEGLDALVERLRPGGHTKLVQELVEAMTTNETLFFRDSKPFIHLAEEALPDAASRSGSQTVRVWSAGSSCGQEAYSIAMIAAEQSAKLAGRAVRVLGTDIATAPLARASQATYTQFEVQRGLSARRLLAHFDRLQDGWQLRQPIRAMCHFSAWNLLDDPAPLGLFDIVFCRNVLIYFNEATKIAVLEALARQLAPEGWLYLGSSESAAGLCPALEQSTAGQPIYRLAKGSVGRR